MKAFEKTEKILNILNEKKALNLSAVEISDLTVVADYFIFATSTSSTHVHALSDEVEYQMEQSGIKPHHIEGRATGWILLDYGDVIVHIFTREQREFYGLDKMWSDGKPVDLTKILKSDTED